MDLTTLINYAISFGIAIPAIVFHEVAHGYAAFALGDTTAKDRGRLSLNPLKHIDPFGTIILPLLLVISFGAGFGYAKPVPVNPWSFRDRRKGMFLVGIAGPATNLVLAILSGLLFRGAIFMLDVIDSVAIAYVAYALYSFCFVNLVLMFFNLIPIPPLDGSRVLPLFLSDRAMHAYAKFERYGVMVLFGLILFGPRLLGIDLVGIYLDFTVDPLLHLLAGV